MNTIAAFFAGLMAFVSGLFGHQVTPTPTSPTLVNQQVISTSSIQTQAISTTDNLMIYRDEKYGLELKYPKPIYKDCCGENNMIVGLGMPSPSDEERSINVIGISVRNYDSLESWYVWRTKEQKNLPPVKDTTIDNLPAKMIPTQAESYGKGTSCQLTGVLYQKKIFEICDSLNNEVSKKIIDSIKFPDSTSASPNEEVESTVGNLPTEILNIPVVLLNNDPVATIQSIGGTVIYTTKDKNKIYFIKLSEKDGSLSCVDLQYLNINEKKYNVIKGGYCPRSMYSISPKYDPEKILPLHIQEGRFDFSDTYNQAGTLNYKNSDLYGLNLETMKRSLLYSNKNPNESLISGCYYIPATYEFLGSLPYLEYTATNRLKIGVYKNVGQNSKPCKYDGKSGYASPIKIEEYEKIRDDIVDLTKIP